MANQHMANPMQDNPMQYDSSNVETPSATIKRVLLYTYNYVFVVTADYFNPDWWCLVDFLKSKLWSGDWTHNLKS